MDIYEKKQKLYEIVRREGRVAVAFSGGIDSAFLLKSAKNALGVDSVTAIMATPKALARREIDAATEFCRKEGIALIKFEFDQLGIPGFDENPKDRCFLCKREMFSEIKRTVDERQLGTILEGSNADDMKEYRPGYKAVVSSGAISPLLEAGLTKSEIRKLAKEDSIEFFDKPSATCAATRLPYGEKITEKKIFMIEKAEDHLLSLGFKDVRVRIHGDLARIELSTSDISKMFDVNIINSVNENLKKLGFEYVTLDLSGR